MMAAQSSMDYGYVSPHISLLVICLVMVILLFVGLAWHNLREIKRILKEFMEGEVAWKIAIALEKDKLAQMVRNEFLKHTHDPANGKVK
jgi:hypothetical protein